MKVKSLLATACALVCATSVQAAEVSYNIGVVSLYKSSGVDQDADASGNAFGKAARPALQGGVDVDLGNGLYVGNWNSTGKFVDGSVEMDLYGGYAGELSGGMSYDVGYAHYFYPGYSDWNGGELYLSLSAGGFTAKVTNGLNTLKNQRRLALSYDYSLTEQAGVNVTYGMRNQAKGGYNDYAVGVSYDLGGDLSASATYSGATGDSTAVERKGRLVFGLSQGF
jgi:uncharacterized protein (TIGR02001 family)